jgi:pyruvate/2-oxoglutarate/acetoin dehydrogenase E1 component
VVSIGAVLSRVLEAAAELAREGIEVEIVDVRTLVPLDLRTILASVARTRWLVVVEDAPLTHGFGAEVIARVSEAAWGLLRAAPRRVAGQDVPIPYNRTLERLALPDAPRIAEAVREVLR